MGALYTDLLTITDLQLESEQFAEFDLSDTGTRTAAQAIINQVTSLIEGGHIGIDRPVVVRAHTIYTQYEDWTYDAARAKYWYQPPRWPVVEIDTTGFTIGSSTSSPEGSDLILYASRYSGAITYYGGYRRIDQALVDLQAETGLDTLGTLPAIMPAVIRDCAIAATMHLLFERRHGPGVFNRTISMATASTTISGPDRDYLKRMFMDRLWHLRRMPA